MRSIDTIPQDGLADSTPVGTDKAVKPTAFTPVSLRT